MGIYDEECIEVFLERQRQLFKEDVATTPEEAEEFLEDVIAGVCRGEAEVREYLDDSGLDISGLEGEKILDQPEVFALSDDRYLVVVA